MKTINQIADEKAKSWGYASIDGAIHAARTTTIHSIILSAAEEYARQCCEEQIKACAENAKTTISAGGLGNPIIIVKSESILSTPNIAEKP